MCRCQQEFFHGHKLFHVVTCRISNSAPGSIRPNLATRSIAPGAAAHGPPQASSDVILRLAASRVIAAGGERMQLGIAAVCSSQGKRATSPARHCRRLRVRAASVACGPAAAGVASLPGDFQGRVAWFGDLGDPVLGTAAGDGIRTSAELIAIYMYL
jgi:hypothetical protein